MKADIPDAMVDSRIDELVQDFSTAFLSRA